MMANTTTTAPDDAPSAKKVLRAVEALAPSISERGAEIEAAMQLPADLLDELHEVGCFRVFRPPSHGGAGAPLPEAMQVLETLGRADASTAWTVAIGASAWCDVAGLPRPTFDKIYDEPNRVVVGVISPSGTATVTAGGYEIAGRWSFASGCYFADWFYCNTVEMIDGEPAFRTVLLQPDEVRIEDTWHVLGMRGTASHHLSVEGVVVPTERTFATFTAEPCVNEAIVRVPRPSLFALVIASVALGAARGALDDLLDLAGTKVPLLEQTPLAAKPVFQHRLAEADTELRAARSLLMDCAAEIWAAADVGSEVGVDLVGRTRAAAAWSTTIAARVANTAYRLGGGSTVYDNSSLQRRSRDIEVIAQHFLVKPDVLTTAGAMLAGQPIDVPVF